MGNTKSNMAQDSRGRATTTTSTMELNREDRERPVRISERVLLPPFAHSSAMGMTDSIDFVLL